MRFPGQAASSCSEVTAFNTRGRYDNAISGLIRTVERPHKMSVKRSAALAASRAFNLGDTNNDDGRTTSYCDFRDYAEFDKIGGSEMVEMRRTE
jgi:hypothetical protein